MKKRREMSRRGAGGETSGTEERRWRKKRWSKFTL